MTLNMIETRRSKLYQRKEALKESLFEEDPNLIAEDLVIKYTINIPVDLYVKIDKLCHDEHGNHVLHKSEWIREKLKAATEESERIKHEMQRIFSFEKKVDNDGR